jgi:dTDP-4-amino-4,6-dideoxygalactose transaminase
MDFIDLASQLQFMRSAIDKRIGTVLNHGQFILGPEVTELEQKLAEYVGVKHCITCANGTDALQIALMSQNIGQGDIVFTTSFSFFATAEVISLVGATPYFVDIDPKTYNVCPQSLASAIKDVKESKQGNPRAVIAVDLFGLPANYIDLETLCKANQLFLIEDAAQGFGGAINGQKAGSFGDIATTSFFPAKPLGCYGDGGAIFTNSEEIADLAKSIRVHGKGSHKYENIRIGLNSRLDTIQAAILLEKLEWFPKELEHRQTIVKFMTL